MAVSLAYLNENITERLFTGTPKAPLVTIKSPTPVAPVKTGVTVIVLFRSGVLAAPVFLFNQSVRK